MTSYRQGSQSDSPRIDLWGSPNMLSQTQSGSVPLSRTSIDAVKALRDPYFLRDDSKASDHPTSLSSDQSANAIPEEPVEHLDIFEAPPAVFQLQELYDKLRTRGLTQERQRQEIIDREVLKTVSLFRVQAQDYLDQGPKDESSEHESPPHPQDK